MLDDKGVVFLEGTVSGPYRQTEFNEVQRSTTCKNLAKIGRIDE